MLISDVYLQNSDLEEKFGLELKKILVFSTKQCENVPKSNLNFR